MSFYISGMTTATRNTTTKTTTTTTSSSGGSNNIVPFHGNSILRLPPPVDTVPNYYHRRNSGGNNAKRFLGREGRSLVKQCDKALESAAEVLLEAEEMVERAAAGGRIPAISSSSSSSAPPGSAAKRRRRNLLESDLQRALAKNREGTNAANSTTAGHCNTDHVISFSGDYKTDRVAELKRNLLNRMRQQQPESKGNDRWDKPRAPGERRRRIVREKDLPDAPPPPPPSGYVIFVGQMTTKIRHDRPNEEHSQTAVVQEISKLWRIALSESEQKYYNDFAERIRKAYRVQQMEYRATGQYTPNETFKRLPGGPWVHCDQHCRSSLEQEICTYETVKFPPRPPELDKEYAKRLEESKRKRKLKIAGRLNPDGTERAVEATSDANRKQSGKRRRRRKSTTETTAEKKKKAPQTR